MKALSTTALDVFRLLVGEEFGYPDTLASLVEVDVLTLVDAEPTNVEPRSEVANGVMFSN